MWRCPPSIYMVDESRRLSWTNVLSKEGEHIKLRALSGHGSNCSASGAMLQVLFLQPPPSPPPRVPAVLPYPRAPSFLQAAPQSYEAFLSLRN